MKFFIMAALLLTLTAHAEPVCKVYDGDTFTMCSGERVRLADVDAPELKQPYGYQSRDFLKSVVAGKDVLLTCKGKSFDRRVCAASVDGLDLGSIMVRSGFAYDSPKYSRGRYNPDQQQAARQGAGVWQQPDGGQRPWDFRKQR